MNIIRAFTYIFSEKQWAQKVMIGSLLLLLCVFILPIPLVAGYLAQTLRAAARRQKDILPAWTNLRELYKTGFMVIVILVSYAIAYYVFVSITKMIPFFPRMYFIFQMIFSFFLPVPLISYISTGKFKEAYEFSKLAGFITHNFWNLILVWIIVLTLIPISLSGITVLLIGVSVTTFYALLVYVYLYGNLLRHIRRKKLMEAKPKKKK